MAARAAAWLLLRLALLARGAAEESCTRQALSSQGGAIVGSSCTSQLLQAIQQAPRRNCTGRQVSASTLMILAS
jgi:hypothetical protein